VTGTDCWIFSAFLLQQAAVVNSNKVNDIMEMMKSDPVFEELFSSFGEFL
jgi:hypothetical protein